MWRLTFIFVSVCCPFKVPPRPRPLPLVDGRFVPAAVLTLVVVAPRPVALAAPRPLVVLAGGSFLGGAGGCLGCLTCCRGGVLQSWSIVLGILDQFHVIHMTIVLLRH